MLTRHVFDVLQFSSYKPFHPGHTGILSRPNSSIYGVRRTACIRQVRWLAELASIQALPSLAIPVDLSVFTSSQGGVAWAAGVSSSLGHPLQLLLSSSSMLASHSCVPRPIYSCHMPLTSASYSHSCLVFYFRYTMPTRYTD